MPGLAPPLKVPWRAAANALRGLAHAPCLPCRVEVLDVGDASCEASDSTSSMEWLCQPLLTLSIA